MLDDSEDEDQDEKSVKNRSQSENVFSNILNEVEESKISHEAPTNKVRVSK